MKSASSYYALMRWVNAEHCAALPSAPRLQECTRVFVRALFRFRSLFSLSLSLFLSHTHTPPPLFTVIPISFVIANKARVTENVLLYFNSWRKAVAKNSKILSDIRMLDLSSMYRRVLVWDNCRRY